MEREPLEDGGSSLIRPYVMTGGRTRPDGPELPIESMVVNSPGVDPTALGFEQAKIAHVCSQPISVVELAAELDMPLGVARILVSDLIGEGVLDANPTAAADAARPDLIERLIEGIRAL